MVSIFVLFLIPLVIVVLGRFDVRTGYLWFLALGGAVIAWALVLFSRSQMPMQIILMQWKPETLFSTTPTLLLDDISWIYAAVITSFPLAVLLTDVIQATDIDADVWATSLAMTGLGLLAVLAENPLTLMLAWVIMDLSETFMLLQRVATSEHRERVVVAFSVRLLGILVVLIANVVSASRETILVFESIPPEVSGIILIAVGLRLGVLPPHQPFFQEPPLRRGLGTIVRLIPVASSLVVLTRLAKVGVPLNWQPFLIVAAVFGALYGSFAWSQAENELDGRPYWILGISAFVLVATIYQLPQASLAWGLALLLSGAVLFLTSYRDRIISVLVIVGFLGISMFPFTPAWMGGSVYNQSGLVLIIVLVIAHALLMLGYFRHLSNLPQKSENILSWMAIVSSIGLLMMIITHWGISAVQGLIQQQNSYLSPGWWAGVFAIVGAAIVMVARRREIATPPQVTNTIRSLLSLEWMYRVFWWIYRSASRLFAYISSILEGEGGVLWAMLILILLIAILSQQGMGS